MSASKGVSKSTKFLDNLMKDNRWRSEKQMLAALVDHQMEQVRRQAELDLKEWFDKRNTYEDHGLRCKTTARRTGRQEVNYAYWRIQPPEKRFDGSDLPDMTREEALALEAERAFKLKREEQAKDEARALGRMAKS